MVRLRSALPQQQSTLRSPPAKNVRSALQEKTNTIQRKAVPQKQCARGNVLKGATATGQKKEIGETQRDVERTHKKRSPAATKSERSPRNDLILTQNVATVKTTRRPPRMMRKAVRSEMPGTAKSQAKRSTRPVGRKKNVPTTSSHDADADTLRAAEVPEQTNVKSPSAQSPPSSPSSAPQSDGSNMLDDIDGTALWPRSMLKPRATPLADNSVLALQRFKRRPRQPSMLAMVQQRLASARPSLATDGGMDIDDVDDDFLPEAEGTPLHTTKYEQYQAPHQSYGVVTSPEHSRHIHKRKSTEPHSSTRKRQRISSDPINNDGLPDPRSEKHGRLLALDSELIADPRDLFEVQVSASELSSPQPSGESSLPVSPQNAHRVPLTQDDDLLYEYGNSTLADPASSSSQPSPSPSASSQGRSPVDQRSAQRRGPPSSPEKQNKPKSKPLSTAMLQSLLPKRRRPHRDPRRSSEFDLPSESEDTSPVEINDTESSDFVLRPTQDRPARLAASRQRATMKNQKRPNKQTPTAKTNPSRTPSDGQASAKNNGKLARTYGRKRVADKENHPPSADVRDVSAAEVDDSTTMEEVAKGHELETARKKFAEIDQWDMEFESMSNEDHGSSSQGWR